MSDDVTTLNHQLSITFGNRSSYQEPRPPLLVKVTGYRLLNITLLLAFGVSRVALMYKGQALAPTILEWVMGMVITLGLYWLGLYESIDPPIWPWLFHKDYSRPLLRNIRVIYIGIRVSFAQFCAAESLSHQNSFNSDHVAILMTAITSGFSPSQWHSTLRSSYNNHAARADVRTPWFILSPGRPSPPDR